MNYSIAVLLLSTFGGFVLSQADNSPELQEGDVSFNCEKLVDEERNFHLRCNFMDRRRPKSFCPSKSFLPNFNKISLRCVSNLFSFSKAAECKIVELRDDGSEKEEKIIFQLDGNLYLNSMELNKNIWDILLNFESILPNLLSIGKALLRCRTGGFQENDKLTCSVFAIGNKAWATGDFSCSAVTSSTTDDLSVNIFLCGFTEDHLSSKYRGNLTVFMKTYNNIEMTTDVLFVAQSSVSPSKFIMKTPRLDCRVVGDNPETQTLSCEVHLNDDKFCKSKQEGRGGDKSEQTERDIFTELDSTIEFDMEDVGKGRVKFNCYQAVDMGTYITKCSHQYSEGRVFLDQKTIIDVNLTPTGIYFSGIHLVSLTFAGKLLFHNVYLERCLITDDRGTTQVDCDIQVEKKLKDKLRCSVKEAEPEGELVKYRVSCGTELLGYSFEGTFVKSLADPTTLQFNFDGDLKLSKDEGLSFQLSSTCSVTGYEHVKVSCKIRRS